MDKPADVFDRGWEWDRLVRFVNEPGDQARLGLVYGRRRQGKSLLTSQLARSFGGFYWEALETESIANLEGLSRAFSTHVGSPGPIRFASWSEALSVLVRFGSRGAGPVVVLDEVQRVFAKAPEVPSVLQTLLGPGGVGAEAAGTRLLLCGSAFGELRRLLDGDAPLRGRASLELVVEPFSYRTAAKFWGVLGNPAAAFRLHALIGGTPAYRMLAGDDSPASDGDVDAWAIRRLLDPSSSLFREGRIVVAEDGQLGDRQLFWGLLSAIADGARQWGDLEAGLGLGRGSLPHALKVAIDAGWVIKRSDPLKANRPTYQLTEPMVRFQRIVIERNERRLSQRRAADVWIDAIPEVATRIYAPHLEFLAEQWLIAHASAATVGGTVFEVGSTVVKAVGQLDVVAVEATSKGGRVPIVVGEVKATAGRVGIAVLDRLDAAALAVSADHRPIKRLLVSAAGFTSDLQRVASRRADVELVDLQRLYHGS